MKVSELKKHLTSVQAVEFRLPSRENVPAHFHITEAGLTTKYFIDCGGTIRTEKTASMQVWVASDLSHRLTPEKLLKIIDISEPLFDHADLDVEVEYQAETIGRYGIEFKENQFVLLPKQTDCLAKENCGVPEKKQKVSSTELAGAKESCCTPGGGCCN